MNDNILKRIKIKAGILAVFVMLLLIGTAYAELTLEDNRITYDDSPLTKAEYNTTTNMLEFIGDVDIKSAYAVNFTDGSYNNWTTMITNTNGRAWEAIGKNIQPAIYDLNGTGGRVYFPQKDYDIFTPIIINQDYITFVGASYGYGTRFLKHGDMPNGMIQVHGTGTGDIVSSICIDNIFMQNYNAEIQSYSGAFINFTFASDVTVKNCHLRFNKDEAVTFRTVWNSKVDNCYIQQCGNTTNTNASILYESADGGISTCTTPWITNNLFEAGGDYCIKNADGYASRGQLLNNWFEYEIVNGASMPATGFIRWAGHYATISGNKMWGNNHCRGIYSTGQFGIITNNEIANMTYGIDVSGAYSIVDGNEIRYCLTRGIQVSNNNVISNNNVLDCGDPSTLYQRGIQGTNDNIIIGNHISGGYNGFRSIALIGDRNSIIGNRIIGAAGVNHGIFIDSADADDNFISENHLTGTFGWGVMGITTGNGDIVSSNVGYTTEDGDNGTYSDGATITHNLTSTPSYVLVTGTIAGEMVSVTAIGATTFTIAIKDHAGNAGTSQEIYWRCYYEP